MKLLTSSSWAPASPDSLSSWGANDETPKPVADTSSKPQRMGEYGQAVDKAEAPLMETFFSDHTLPEDPPKRVI